MISHTALTMDRILSKSEALKIVNFIRQIINIILILIPNNLATIPCSIKVRKILDSIYSSKNKLIGS